MCRPEQIQTRTNLLLLHIYVPVYRLADVLNRERDERVCSTDAGIHEQLLVTYAVPSDACLDGKA